MAMKISGRKWNFATGGAVLDDRNRTARAGRGTRAGRRARPGSTPAPCAPNCPSGSRRSAWLPTILSMNSGVPSETTMKNRPKRDEHPSGPPILLALDFDRHPSPPVPVAAPALRRSGELFLAGECSMGLMHVAPAGCRAPAPCRGACRGGASAVCCCVRLRSASEVGAARARRRAARLRRQPDLRHRRERRAKAIRRNSRN